MNAPVSIHVLQPYSNFEMHTALNREILKLRLTFGENNIDLNLANVADPNFNIALCRSNGRSEISEVINYID